MQGEKISIVEPKLYQFTDPAKFTRMSPVLGRFDKPDNTILGQKQYRGINFNYFINWNSRKVVSPIWEKVLFSIYSSPSLTCERFNAEYYAELVRKIADNLGEEEIAHDKEMFRAHNVSGQYIALYENHNKIDPDSFVACACNFDGEGDRAFSMKDLQKYITSLKGTLDTKHKELRYTESNVEGYLSRTDTCFPGDCDELIYNKKTNDILCIVEYKKCTKLDKKVKDQSFEERLRNDKKKYPALEILREQFSSFQSESIPMFAVLYSVEPNDPYTKVEEIKTDLTCGRSVTYKKAATPRKNKVDLYNHLLELRRSLRCES